MDKLKIIITGTTGMVGEGVLLECLQNEMISEILIVNRKHYDLSHPKLKELLIKDFTKIENSNLDKLKGFDACFYCAGISSIGMKEEQYNHITFDITVSFAQTLLNLNPNFVFHFVSGRKIILKYHKQFSCPPVSRKFF